MLTQWMEEMCASFTLLVHASDISSGHWARLDCFLTLITQVKFMLLGEVEHLQQVEEAIGYRSQ